MAIEIERKFLVRETAFLEGRQGERIMQGYVAKEPGAMTTRVRIRADRAYVTIKGPRVGLARDEFEYPIPLEDARLMLDHYCAGRTVAKTRYLVDFAGNTFEVDVFEGRHAGLVVAEIEIEREDAVVQLPPWIGREVSDDPYYGNFSLATTERSSWLSRWLSMWRPLAVLPYSPAPFAWAPARAGHMLRHSGDEAEPPQRTRG